MKGTIVDINEYDVMMTARELYEASLLYHAVRYGLDDHGFRKTRYFKARDSMKQVLAETKDHDDA